MRVRRVILSSVTSPAVPYFATLCHKVTIFGKILLNIKYVFFIFFKTFIRNISYSKKN